MDLRNATKPKGTTTSKKVTSDHAISEGTPTYNEDGTLGPAPAEFATNLLLIEYWDFLRDNGITKNDLRSILDSLVTSGNVAWDFKLFDRIQVKFQVRSSWVDDVIIEKVDDATANHEKVSAMRYNNMVAEMNLAASLIQFGEHKFAVKDAESLEEAIDFVKKLAYIFRNQLVNKLAVFDRAVAVATSDWALKNFTTPLMAE